MKVAIIGFGAAGIITSDICRSKGFDVTIYEKSFDLGGVWKFDGKGPMYDSIKTNLPIEIMEINSNYPFEKSSGNSFVGHEEVYKYLENYSKVRDLHKLVRFSTTVKNLYSKTDFWIVESINEDNESSHEKFDYVIVCNGHYNIPLSPIYEGICHFKGKTIHSIEYSHIVPSEFTNLSVVVVGARSSATDIAREISLFTKQTYVSDRNLQGNPVNYGKIHHYPSLSFISEDGNLNFADGSILKNIDVILFCTGYLYDYPFIKTSKLVDQCIDINNQDQDQLLIDRGRAIVNVYQNLFFNENHRLAFIGLPWSVVPFHMFYLQAHMVTSVFLDPKILPDKTKRDEWINLRIKDLKGKNEYPDKFHYLGENQWYYFRYLASQSGLLDAEEEKYIQIAQEIFDNNKKYLPKYPGEIDSYRSRSFSVNRVDGTWNVY